MSENVSNGYFREECLYCHNNGIHEACPVCDTWNARPEKAENKEALSFIEKFDPDYFFAAYP